MIEEDVVIVDFIMDSDMIGNGFSIPTNPFKNATEYNYGSRRSEVGTVRTELGTQLPMWTI